MRFVKMKEKIRFLQLDDSFKQYDVVADQQASELMQQLARSRWNFPMILYFEAYGEKDEILATKSVQVQLFVLTNMPCIKYEGEHPTVQSLDAEIIMADYDGQGALLITNKSIHITGGFTCDSI